MLTWKLWRAVRNPPSEHPIFVRTFKGKSIQFHRWGFLAWMMLSPFVICSLGIYLRSIIFTAAVVMQFYFLYVGLHSLTWAVNVSSSIAKEQETRTHDLLGVTPIGSIGAYWAIFTGSIYRKKEFHNYNSSEASWIIRVLFAIAIVFLTVGGVDSRFTTTTDVVPIVYFVCLVTAFYYDHIQSVLLACLTGMVISTTTRSTVESRLFVLGGFLLVQGVSYTLVWFTGFVVLSTVYDALPQKSTLVEITLPILRLILFFAIREGLIRQLWTVLGQELNASVYELSQLTTPAVEQKP